MKQKNDAEGDLSKKWFVYYFVRDPGTDRKTETGIDSVFG